MQPEHTRLLSQLEQFQFTATFTERLARDNGWSVAYARRACDEYKRFAFLALASGHPCTPSDEVDQVWHLHLIHTEQYWHVFCDEVLRAALHHAPSRGGHEVEKFRDWYATTLESYRTVFADEPPRDIWPAVELRFATRALRVDRRAFWLVPKPRFSKFVLRLHRRAVRTPSKRTFAFAGLAICAAALASATLVGCTLVHAIPPFDFRGPQFIGFFVALWSSCLVIASLLRRRAQARAAVAPSIRRDLDPYETAYLAGGSDRTAHALIVSLIESQSLTLDKDSGRLVAEVPPALGADPLELQVFRGCERNKRGAFASAVRTLVQAHSEQLAHALERDGLILPHAQRKLWLKIALLAPALGVIKLSIGLAFGRPVGFLFVLCGVSTLISVSMFNRRPVRTASGDAELERMRLRANPASEAPPVIAASTLPVAYAVGLFGLGILANTALADVGTVLAPPSSSGGGGGCGGDSGGCGGGGGCGGCGGCGG